MDIPNSLNKIADTLKMRIDYADGKASGSTKFQFTPLPGLAIDIDMQVKKLFASDAVGVLAHVMGDLHIVVTHLGKTNAVNVFLVDGNKLEMDGVKTPPEMFISKQMDTRQVVSSLRKAIVTAFLWKDRKWSVLKLPA